MKKIEINEENYTEYQDFLDAKIGVSEKHEILWSIGITLLTLGTAVGIMVGFALVGGLIWGIAGNLFPIETTGNLLVSLLIGGMGASATCIGFVCLGVKAVLSIAMKYIPMKIFQKKHPDFDINIDVAEVEKELEKYEQLSKVPKDIEKQKEEHLENYRESMKEISVEERLEFLKKEKEFWEQVKVQEKYQEAGEEKAGPIGIGQNCSEKEEKVYHI